MTGKDRLIPIQPDLESRLAALASRSGNTVAEFVGTILRSYADEQERTNRELEQDEERWQRYLASGRTVPFEAVRDMLQTMATETARGVKRR